MQKWPLAQLGMIFVNLCFDNIWQLMGRQMNRMTAMESVARLPIRDITFHFWQQTHPPRHNLVDWGPFAIINRNKSQLAQCRTWSTFCNPLPAKIRLFEACIFLGLARPRASQVSLSCSYKKWKGIVFSWKRYEELKENKLGTAEAFTTALRSLKDIMSVPLPVEHTHLVWIPYLL